MTPRLTPLVTLPGRQVWWLTGTRPACYLLADRDAGGVLINTPVYDESLAAEVVQAAPVRFIFLPSHLGAHDLGRWRARLAAETLATPEEASAVGGADIVIEGRRKLTRTMDLLPMSGRTAGTCALQARNLPGLLFLGPILSPMVSGWPGLEARDGDVSYENRLIGSLALKDLRFEYVFTDDFEIGVTRFCPGAALGVGAELERLWAG